jgi:hypothetical protein
MTRLVVNILGCVIAFVVFLTMLYFAAWAASLGAGI